MLYTYLDCHCVERSRTFLLSYLLQSRIPVPLLMVSADWLNLWHIYLKGIQQITSLIYLTIWGSVLISFALRRLWSLLYSEPVAIVRNRQNTSASKIPYWPTEKRSRFMCRVRQIVILNGEVILVDHCAAGCILCQRIMSREKPT